MEWSFLAALASACMIAAGLLGLAIRRLTAKGTQRKWIVKLAPLVAAMLVGVFYAVRDFARVAECRTFPICVTSAVVWHRFPRLYIGAIMGLVIFPAISHTVMKSALKVVLKPVLNSLEAAPRWLRLPKR